MRAHWIVAVCLFATPARAAPPDVVGQIDRLVRAGFYAPAQLAARGWDDAVREARAAQGTRAALARLVARLGASHTEYIAADDPRFAQILAIFEGILPTAKDRCPDLSKLPALPVEAWDAGVWWRWIDGAWFVGGVLDDSPAARAGLVLGDEVVRGEGAPFQPVASLAGKRATLAVRRVRGGALRRVVVEPRRVRPQEAFRAAIGASARIVARGARRIAYVRVWSWAGLEMQDALEEAIDQLNASAPDGWVIDLRDGWGGASPDYLRIFDRHVPVLAFADRDGKGGRVDRHLHAPAVVLINGGSRSGKEVVAYGVKKWKLATLVGERTAGAVLAGGIYCLDDGGLLYLASGGVTVDGEVLEGKGVEPDVRVAFDLRYAAGKDPQLEAALDEAARGAAR
jgi:carboxyl-terminal processing protease